MTPSEKASVASHHELGYEWSRTTLAKIGSVVRGASPRPAGDPKYFNGDFMPWLTVAALTNIPACQLTVCETAGKLTEAGAQFSRTLAPGTVIIANSGATLGVAKILGVRCCANDGIAALLELRSDVDARYVVHYINSQTERLRNVVATGNGQPNLNTGLIGAIEIDLPIKREQSAIADALGSVDALIDSLEQLLTKKRQIKQGAMQELLTGKRRLPGFTGEWMTASLGQIAKVKTGSMNNQDKVEDGEYPFFVRSQLVERIDTFTHDCEAILIPGEGGIGSIFHYINGRFALHQRVYAVTDFNDTALGRLLYFYMRVFFGAHAMENSVKATVDSLRLPTFLDFEIRLPPTKTEQNAIVDVLSDIEIQVESLESRLSKARALKQAMAQALLTGRIRLVEPTA